MLKFVVLLGLVLLTNTNVLACTGQKLTVEDPLKASVVQYIRQVALLTQVLLNDEEPSTEKDAIEADLRKKLKGAQNLYLTEKYARLKMRLDPQSELYIQSKLYIEKYKEARAALYEIDEELASFEVGTKRSLLMARPKTNPSSNDPYSGNTELLDKTKRISAQNTEMLKNALRILNETEEVGKAALAMLKEDGESLKRIQGQLEIMDSDLALAHKHLTRMTKRLSSDRIIQSAALVVTGLVGWIVAAHFVPALI